jgi:radical SAM superfamily enzyme YgiQ (UPF0313 family)
MADVLLIHPPVSFKNRAWENEIIPNCPPLGLLYLAATVEKLGFSARIIDAIDGSYILENIGEIIKQEQPKIIGITAMTMNIKGAVQVAKFIKETISSNIKIVLGGPHISADPTIISRYPYFDFGITGEADITFPELVKRIISNSEEVHGLYPGEVPFDLDSIPLPARHLIDFQTYKRRHYWTNAIFATRGCPYHCTFCSAPAMDKKVRFRSPKNIINEMEHTYKITGIKSFVFIDDALTLKKSFVHELCIEMQNLSFQAKWAAQSRINCIDDELLKAMRKAGCYELIFGVESGSEKIRNEIINKNISDQQIELVTKLCRNNGIEPDHYLMLGFPTESKEDLYKTVNCPAKFKPNIIGVHLTMPLPGSPLFEDAIKDGIIEPDVIDKYISGKYGEGYKGTWPYYIPKGITYEELIEARNEMYRKFYLRPSYILKRAKKDFTSWTKLKIDIRQGISLFFKGASVDDTTQ